MRISKKWLSTVTVCTLITGLLGGLPAPQASAASTLDQGLVVHYDFADAAKSTTVADSSGNHFDGTLVNASVVTTADKGGAVDLSGEQSYVKMPEGVLNGLTDMTVSSWVYMDSSKNWASLYSFGNAADVDPGTQPFTAINFAPVSNDPAETSLEITKSGFGSNQIAHSSPVPSGQWKQLTTVVSGTDGYTAIYMDGVLQQRLDGVTTAPKDITSKYNYIGYAQFGWEQGAGKGLDGRVADFRIYNRVLAADEITSLYTGSQSDAEVSSIQPSAVTVTAGQTPSLPASITATYSNGAVIAKSVQWPSVDAYINTPGVYTIEGTLQDTTMKAVLTLTVNAASTEVTPTIWYKFDEASGTTVANSGTAGSAWDAAVMGGTSWSTGHLGGAVQLDGSSGYVQMPSNLQYADNMTVATWVNLTKDNSPTMLFVSGTAANNDNFYLSTHGIWQPSYMAAVNDASLGTNYQIYDSSAIGLNQWVHVAITFSGKEATLYRDGVQIAKKTLASKPSDFNGQNLLNYIGKSVWPDPYIQGKVDDFRIYDQALSASDIAELVQSSYPDTDVVNQVKANLTLGDTTAVLSDITLPAPDGVTVTWSSDDTAHLSNTGHVTRPAQGEPDATVHLTATITKNAASVTKVFTVTVLSLGSAPYRIQVNGDQTGIDISPDLYGIFFEDINYAADGGLYAELVQNRSFEYTNDHLKFWSKVTDGGAAATIASSHANPLNTVNTNYLELNVTAAGDGAGVANSGFGGIPLVQSDKYDFSLYTRSSDFSGPLEVTLESADGTKQYAKAELPNVTSEWTKSSVVLTPDQTDANARIVVRAKGTGTIDMDMVSLFPERTWKGRPNGMRYDLAKKLYDLHPSFMRFPGGCVVQGKTLDNAYRWKDSVGDVAQRKPNYNFWQNTDFPDYYQTSGIGYYEYFQFSEDIGAKPLPVINSGMSIQVGVADADVEMVPLDQLGPYIQDALDLIEFANGDPASNEWAKLRSDMGHPAPFNLEYLAIGNEQWGAEYYPRYKMFADAIKAKYPNIQLIIGSGTESSGTNYEAVQQWIQSQAQADRPEIVDEHYYMNPDWFLQNVNRYDSFNRTDMPKVFVGEYAAHTNGNFSQGVNNLKSAISEAAFMTGLEENADVIRMASYAPLFAKQNFTQWQPDLIWFNNTASYGSINYYVQQLYSNNVGNQIVPSEILKGGQTSSKVSGAVGVGSYNTANEFDDIQVVSNTDAAELFADDFSGDASKWTPVRGTFAIQNGVYQQTSTSTANAFAYAGSTDMDNYTLTLKARKTGGAEGVNVYVGVKDANNYFRWNIGGYNNTKSTFEKSVNGTVATVSEYDYSKLPKLTTNTWYNLKIVVTGKRMKAYVDDTLVFDILDNPKSAPLFTTTSKDTATGDVILKVVNSSDESQETSIHLNGLTVGTTAIKTVLQGADLNALNTFASPKTIVPVTTKETGITNQFVHVFEPHSLTIYRFRTAPGAAPELASIQAEASKTQATAGDTFRLDVKGGLLDDSSEADLRTAAITYSSNHPELISFDDEGKAKIATNIGGVTEVTVWADVSLNGTSVKSNETTIALAELSAETVVKTAKAELSLGNTTFVTANLTLPTSADNDVQISWTTSNYAVVTDTGVVTRPASGNTMISVTLTALISKNGYSETKAFTIAVPTQDIVLSIESLKRVEVITPEGTAPQLPSTVTAKLTDGSTQAIAVTWNSVESSSTRCRANSPYKGRQKEQRFLRIRMFL
ncbi:LamG-like jellyroll fold domain-containing protein [Paenibacillus hexagrammi]|uniref:non-reducing end alpha-L-arabinofuranosidase n=1 Tax=Paenibacillus hexagrammi TaxID=2908839 RepID=A0ABY3SIY7_9BACL|nr:LamG-like jellyroll fold domain-containing protein [Paenibacillus sp. YPD9-1]UJF33896.1 Ig-like domain-containing protein [Paenibacillus sp. YPD9-1]